MERTIIGKKATKKQLKVLNDTLNLHRGNKMHFINEKGALFLDVKPKEPFVWTYS